MTVNEFIKKLENLQTKLREKEILFTAPNGEQFEPDIKMLLIDEMNIFGSIDNVKAIIIC